MTARQALTLFYRLRPTAISGPIRSDQTSAYPTCKSQKLVYEKGARLISDCYDVLSLIMLRVPHLPMRAAAANQCYLVMNQAGKTAVPQGLKPNLLLAPYGMAKAMPLQNDLQDSLY